MGDLLGALKAEGKEIEDSPASAENLGELLKMIASGALSGKLAKEVFAKMFAGEGTGRRDRDARRDSQQIGDSSRA